METLLTGMAPVEVEVSLPQGGSLTIAVREVTVPAPGEALGTVIKDAGDDPDVTHRAAVSSRVLLGPGGGGEGEISFRRGPGVGLVTRPGLPVAEGEPAINPTPREMIAGGLRQVWGEHRPGQSMPGPGGGSRHSGR